MSLYRVEVKICATAYVKANNPTEAIKKATALSGSSPDILDSGGEVPVSGAKFDDPALPEISLSPAMTIHGVWRTTKNAERVL